MKFLLLVLFFPVVAIAQPDTAQARLEFNQFVKDQNEHYFNKETSPFRKNRDRRKFKGHDFFPFSSTFIVKARFRELPQKDTIIMMTSANTEKVHLRYGEVIFELNGSICKLITYQNVKLKAIEGYENHLFLPFRDATSGVSTYGGGRYLDLEIPEGDTIWLNFNLAYNPYCAYTIGWYCSIPPEENTLTVEINAGARLPHGH